MQKKMIIMRIDCYKFYNPTSYLFENFNFAKGRLLNKIDILFLMFVPHRIIACFNLCLP